MKIIRMLFALLVATMFACNGGGTKTESTAETSPDSFLLPKGVIFVRGEKYKPSNLEASDTLGFPLVFLDDRKYGIDHNVDKVVVDNVGGKQTEFGTIYDMSVMNRSGDSLRIEKLWIEDPTFDGYIYEGTWIKGLISWIKLRSDSAVSRKDFHIGVTFKDNKFPPQILCVNLHPSMLELKAKYAEEHGIEWNF